MLRWRLLPLPLLLALLCQQPLRAQYASDRDDNDDGALYVLGGILAGIVASSPFWVPHLVLEEDGGDPAFFYEYPFQSSEGDYMYRGFHPPEHATVWSANLIADYGTDFDVDRYGTRLTIDTATRFGIDSEWNLLQGDMEGRPWDEMETGDFHITMRFAQHPRVQFRAGAGLRWLSDDLDTNYGISGQYGVEIQPVRPLILSVQLEAGTLRHDPFLHGRATIGLIYNRFELFTGFDYLQIDHLETAGPLAGLRIWL